MINAHWWLAFPFVLVALGGREFVRMRARPRGCPQCGYRGVRLVSRNRLLLWGLVLFMVGAYATGWWVLAVVPGLLLLWVSGVDEARLYCRACRWGGPASLART